MDKVNGANSQAMPLWERSKSQRGHRSAVDGALKAHRQRTIDRQARVQARLDMVKGVSNDFFPSRSVAQPQVAEQQLYSPIQQNQNNQVPQAVAQEVMNIEQIEPFQPREMDEIYKEASLGSTGDNALAVVEKEIANPEDAPRDDVPKGSYVDYTI